MVDRINVGQLAELYLTGRMSFADFMLAAPEDPQDEEVAELIDLIEHEPRRGGFLGASIEEHDRHLARIRELARSINSRESAVLSFSAGRKLQEQAPMPIPNVQHCCQEMTRQVQYRCDTHLDPTDCPDALVGHFGGGEYGIRIHDGGSAFVRITYCPWCGTKLLDPLRRG